METPANLPTLSDARVKNCARKTETKLSQNRVFFVTLAVTIGHMNPTKPARIVWLSLLAFLVIFWIAIIWLAITVTETVVAMLEYVVELAQLY